MVVVPTNESKEIIKKYEEAWVQIRDLSRSTTKNPDDYDEKYIKIKFDLDDNLPLNKALGIHFVKIVVRSIQNNKYYPQVFFDACLYEL